MINIVLAFVAFLSFVACDGNDAPASTLPVRQVTVEAGGVSEKLTVEVAATDAQRGQGLMYRQTLADDAGMLFLFPSDVTTGFWMKNTYLPLSIAYIGADGRVLAIKDGTPLDETVLSPGPGITYRNVIEVNQGWFERKGLGVGSVVRLPADLPAAQ